MLTEFQGPLGGYYDFTPTFQNYETPPHSSPTKASVTARAGLVTRLAADSTATELRMADMRGIQIGTAVRLRMTKEDGVMESPALKVTAIDSATGTVTITPAITETFEASRTAIYTDIDVLDAIGAITCLANPFSVRRESFAITANEEGSWGRSIDIQFFHESAARAPLEAILNRASSDAPALRLRSGAGFYDGAWVEIDTGAAKLYRRARRASDALLELEGPLIERDVVAAGATVSTCEFGMIVSYKETIERYHGLTLERVPGRHYCDRINGISTLIRVSGPPASTDPFAYPSGDRIPAGGLRSARESLRLRLLLDGSDGSSTRERSIEEVS